jgi:GAF domain-containing protein
MIDLDTTDPIDATQAMAELSGMVLSDHSYEAVLGRATLIAQRAIPGAAEVSVTMENDRPVTVASSGPLANEVDESQYDAGYGPCLDALRLGVTIVVEDQATESRWPEYSPRAAAAGVRSSLSVPLPVDGHAIGAFNCYALQSHAFDEVAIKTAEDLAVYAGIVLNNADLYFTASSRAEQMAEAMKSRAVIEQAKGILIGSRRCDADDAFGILVRLSQETHRKLFDVAQAMVDQAVARA